MNLNVKVLHGSLGAPTVIFVHGFMGDHRDFLPFAEQLKSKGVNSVTFDLPGHGSSPVPVSRQFDVVCADMWHELKWRVNGPVFVVGYSLGARIALSWKSEFDKDIDFLLLESGSFGIADTQQRCLRLKKDEQLLNRVISGQQSFESFINQWYSLPLFTGIKGAPLYDAMKTRRLEQAPEVLQHALNTFSVGNMKCYLDQLSSFSGKVLYLSGVDDKRYLDQAKQTPPSWQRSSVIGASHNVHLQKPQEYFQILCSCMPMPS